MNYWLVKSDADEYPWEKMVSDKSTDWTGIRNYAARIHLRAMKTGDQVFFYHSGDEKAIVGIVSVEKEAVQEKGAEEGWVMVRLRYEKPLKNPVTLAQIKSEKSLAEIPLIKISRLSVMPIEKQQFDTILKMSGGK